jgi:hypothetical protein
MLLLLMHSLTGCTVPDEAIEPEEEGTIPPVPTVPDDIVVEPTIANGGCYPRR